MPRILEGKTHARNLEERLRAQIAEARMVPHLAIVQIGSDERSNIYIKRKIAYGESVGAKVTQLKLNAETSEEEVLDHIARLNEDASVHGIIVQLPLPAHMDKIKLFKVIAKEKDVDGLGPAAVYELFTGGKGFVPATAKAVIHLLEECHITIGGKRAVIVGRSNLVSKPLSLALLNRDATVTICHRKTEHLEEITRGADILIVAAGSQGLITRDHVSSEQTVIDVGINPGDPSVRGDTDFDGIKDIVSAISPVPGGVGPLTVACLFENLWQAYYNAQG